MEITEKTNDPNLLFLNKKEEEIKNKIIEFNSNPDSRESIEKFLSKVLKYNWLDYYTLKIYNKEDIDYQNNLILFYQKIVEHLPDALINIFKDSIKLKFIKENPSNGCDLNTIFENLNYLEFSKKDLVDVMVSEKFITSLSSIFESVENYVESESSPILNSLLFGRTGAGKTTLACIIEGYFCSLNNSIPSQRNISNNGRGTDKFEKIQIKIGKILLNLCDFTGFSDPGKGFKNSVIFNKLIDNLSENVLDNKVQLDTILYCLDLSIPRLDQSDYNLLYLFMKRMKEIYNDLDYWKNVILVLTKANLVKLVDYEKYGGLPPYKLKSYLEKHNKIKNSESIEEYNNIYGDKLIDVMDKWKQLIEERVFKKVNDNRICEDEDGQSFNIYFKRIASELYPELSEDDLNDVFTTICSNIVITGDVEKDINNPDWDFRDSIIKPIPNFDDALNESFQLEEYDLMKDTFYVSKNWFNTLQNKINYCSKSSSFKLTVAKLNSMKFSTSNNSNSNIKFSEAVTKDINNTAENLASNKSFLTLLLNLFSFVLFGLFSNCRNKN